MVRVTQQSNSLIGENSRAMKRIIRLLLMDFDGQNELSEAITK